MSERTLTYYFSLQSPWSSLGHPALMEVVRRHDLRVVWKPISLPKLFPEPGGLPLAKRHPLRQAYRDLELKRWRLKLGVPLSLRPAFWPLDVSLADRAVVALADEGRDPDGFVRRGFAGIWAEDLNLADEDTIATLLAASGHDPVATLARARSDESATAYDGNGKEALEAGVFGAPTYVLGGEPFWGQDRIGLLDEALTSGRPPF